MNRLESYSDFAGEVETALLDAELFLKYQAADKAVARLQRAIVTNQRSIVLHDKLRELMLWQSRLPEAARHCLALATLLIERENFDQAREHLLEAKQLDPRISIAPGLEAIRRARQPQQVTGVIEEAAPSNAAAPRSDLLSGRLGPISFFDVVQILENGRLTGDLALAGARVQGHVFFNEGNIVGAETAGIQGEHAFRRLIQAEQGTFDFTLAETGFPVIIEAASNTKLLLDTLRILDEEKAGVSEML